MRYWVYNISTMTNGLLNLYHFGIHPCVRYVAIRNEYKKDDTRQIDCCCFVINDRFDGKTLKLVL